MIRTVIFDIGNVLVKFAWKPYVYGTFDQETADIIANAVWYSGYWEEFDRGVLSDAEIVKLMEDAEPAYKKEIHQTLEHAGEFLEQYGYSKDWIRELKEAGYQVLYLSNYGESLIARKPEVLDFIPMMDGGIFSCHVKRIKPDLEIYKALCERYDLKPEECLFIDDSAPNIEAAKALGLHAIRFENYEKDYDKIMNFLAEENGVA